VLGSLTAGDRLVVSELSRLGRSLGQVIQLIDELVKRKVRFAAIKENIRFERTQDLQTKVMIALFGLFAEIERDLISERTKEGLVAARARGRPLGRPQGSLGTSKLDGKEEEIRKLLEKEVSKRSLAKSALFGPCGTYPPSSSPRSRSTSFRSSSSCRIASHSR
jgi:DNA invertase Pin-like site-specific DNA recombinase